MDDGTAARASSLTSRLDAWDPRLSVADNFATRPQSVAVVIDNFNYGRYVGEAIESALAQTCPVQVIVVDDGSTDNSAEVIASFGRRVEAVFKPNGGHASALNAGFRRAISDVVLFLDSDDVLEPHAAQTLLSEWRPGTVLAHYPMKLIDATGRQLGIHPDPPSSLADGDVRDELLSTGTFGRTVTSGMAFDRAALGRVMPIPELRFVQAADGYLVGCIAFHGMVQRIETCLARYRQHGRNDSDVNATAGGLAAGFRKKIRYARAEFDAVRDAASTLGLIVAADLGEENADFLGYRLFSLALEPELHPIAADRRAALFKRYVAARWGTSGLTLRGGLALATATAAAFGSPSTATEWIRWLHSSTSRPEWMRWLAARARQMRTPLVSNLA